ncbi:MAG: lysophospholipase [Hylemonella sp.]|nr:lysophospholipase [Hylemonella sp.]
MEDSILAPYTTSDGENVAIHDWPVDSDANLRGVVLLVHGLGEHAGRYRHVAEKLNEWGFAVRGYDQYGHGESSGIQGHLPTEDRLLADLAEIVEMTRRKMGQKLPLILLGHSMGGVVAARLVSMMPRSVDGLVLSSPALIPALSGLQSLLLSLMLKIAPDFPIGNGIDPTWISHDLDVVRAYETDRRVHNRVSARLVKFMQTAGLQTLALAPQWKVPTLLLYAGEDRLVNPEGSRLMADALTSDVGAAHCYAGMYHEIFNEIGREMVFEDLRKWLEARF